MLTTKRLHQAGYSHKTPSLHCGWNLQALTLVVPADDHLNLFKLPARAAISFPQLLPWLPSSPSPPASICPTSRPKTNPAEKLIAENRMTTPAETIHVISVGEIVDSSIEPTGLGDDVPRDFFA